MKYEPVIGLEVHVQLKTKTKAFCGCPTEFGKEPNSQACPVCLGFPGSLPVLNKAYLYYAIKTALALNCAIQEKHKFDRKNYFYPDLPKNYQISQYDLPLAKKGYLDIAIENKIKRIRINRVHMEEDAGKLIHQEDLSLLDFNRTGMPLLEIVTEPDINSPNEAYEYLTSLKNLLEYLDVSDCDMEKGSLRCDVNISLRPEGTSTLGIKTELKNMNSFKGVKDSLTFEIKRQQEILTEGGKLTQETRLWDDQSCSTLPMRLKEEAKDYRYFPEPDLPLFINDAKIIEEIKKTIPELPHQKLERFIKAYGLSESSSKILIANKKDAAFAEECINEWPDKDKRPVVNWLIGPLIFESNNRKCNISDLNIPGGTFELINLIKSTEDEKISNLTAKSVLSESLDTAKTPSQIIKEKNLEQVSDVENLNKIAQEVIKENARSVSDYKQGKDNAIMFLVGSMMKKSKGKANPKTAQEILREILNTD
ncbi:MAG: Asp-tRNA(Asn)/Glu-tRNA(Gln) amidotransferase subunit GatB [Candidatus Omnitrophota bacterium]|nr:Asp-tRNA(Asn)/Glu-tRNA(Gln) amidotransferase subunit GatB [Candidatus Omnitrophota bacterium]